MRTKIIVEAGLLWAVCGILGDTSHVFADGAARRSFSNGPREVVSGMRGFLDGPAGLQMLQNRPELIFLSRMTNNSFHEQVLEAIGLPDDFEARLASIPKDESGKLAEGLAKEIQARYSEKGPAIKTLIASHAREALGRISQLKSTEGLESVAADLAPFATISEDALAFQREARQDRLARMRAAYAEARGIASFFPKGDSTLAERLLDVEADDASFAKTLGHAMAFHGGGEGGTEASEMHLARSLEVAAQITKRPDRRQDLLEHLLTTGKSSRHNRVKTEIALAVLQTLLWDPEWSATFSDSGSPAASYLGEVDGIVSAIGTSSSSGEKVALWIRALRAARSRLP